MNFFVVEWGHVSISRNTHNRDATGLEKFENVSSPERYLQWNKLINLPI